MSVQAGRDGWCDGGWRRKRPVAGEKVFLDSADCHSSMMHDPPAAASHLQVAALRLRKQGSHGGHNGMRSIISCLGGTQVQPCYTIGRLRRLPRSFPASLTHSVTRTLTHSSTYRPWC